MVGGYGDAFVSASYRIVISDPFGTPLADASDFISLKYARVTNDVSTLTLTLPSAFNAALLRIPDGRIEVWRRIDGGREYLDTETTWLIKAVEYVRDASGKVVIVVEADTPLSILGDPGRMSYAYSALWGSNGSGLYLADTFIQLLAFYALGDSAANAAAGDYRKIVPQYITLAAPQGLGAPVSKTFAWRGVLKVMQEIAEASTQQGAYIAFDIVAPTPSTYQFRTYAYQRGVDHRYSSGINPVLLSSAFGNLSETKLRRDYRDMASKVYVGGKGDGASQIISSRTDTALTTLSPFSLREKFIECTNSTDETTLGNEAYAELRASRPRVTLSGRIIQTPDTLYGVHWQWGDYVTVQDFGQSFDCRIDAITVTVSNGNELIDAWLRGEL